MIPIGAGVLDTISDLCTRKDWLEVLVPKVLYEGQKARIGTVIDDGIVIRGEVTIKAVSEKYRHIYVDQIPPGTVAGDLVLIEVGDDDMSFHGLARRPVK